MSNANDFVIERGSLERYMGNDVHVAVPDKVKTISSYAFQRNTDIRSVQLPDSVTKISDEAFKDCIALERINIPEGVKIIGTEAFRNCRRLQEITFAGAPEKVGLLAFFGCWKLAAGTAGFPEQVQQFFTRMSMGEISLDEAKKLYVFSKAKGVATVKEFQGVAWKDGGSGKYVYYFNNRENSVIIPTKIGDLSVVKAPCKQIPDEAMVYCSEEYYDKLSRSVRANIAAAWLCEDKLLQDDLEENIRAFIKKYADDVAWALGKCDDSAAYRRFVEVAQPKSALIEKMVEQCQGNAEILAVLLGASDTPQASAADLTLDEKPKLSVAELKKLWTYQTLSVAASGEKYIEITNYKGRDKHVEIPSFIGKVRVGVVTGTFPEWVETVEFPSEDIQITCSFRNCKAMADADGFIAVNAGGRRILTDYIGPQDVEILSIPEGITENTYGTFKSMNFSKVIIPEGVVTLAGGSFSGCKQLSSVSLPESLRKIGSMAFQGCASLHRIRIPESATEVEPLDITRHHDENFVICGKQGSAAQAYAEKYSLPFVAE